MTERNNRCKYCDTKIKYGNMCYTCKEKLLLIRRMQAMVRSAKESVKKK